MSIIPPIHSDVANSDIDFNSFTCRRSNMDSILEPILSALNSKHPDFVFNFLCNHQIDDTDIGFMYTIFYQTLDRKRLTTVYNGYSTDNHSEILDAIVTTISSRVNLYESNRKKV